MHDLTDWLRAQLDHDERVARECPYERWSLTGPSGASPTLGGTTDGKHHAHLAEPVKFYDTKGATLRHAQRWDPARVLAEIEAKRRLLDVVLAYEAKIDGEWGCCHSSAEIAAGKCEEHPPNKIHAIRLLAQPYAGRPGWREEWAA